MEILDAKYNLCTMNKTMAPLHVATLTELPYHNVIMVHKTTTLPDLPMPVITCLSNSQCPYAQNYEAVQANLLPW